MKLSKLVSSLLLAGMVVGIPTAGLAATQGPYVSAEKSQGQLGAVLLNPYEMAPQTAVINYGGKSISDVTVTIEPKKGGSELTYKVPQSAILTHDGIPVFGLYADHNNKVHVSYTLNKKKIKETYRMYVNPIVGFEGALKTSNTTTYTPVKTSSEFKDRLYLVNNIYNGHKPDLDWKRAGGAFEFAYPTTSEIIDISGDIRWHFALNKIYQKDSYNIDKMGLSSSWKQLENGDFIFVQGQRYSRYDIMGRKVYDRRLPRGYIDAAHEILEMNNGNLMIRTAKKDYHRPDGRVVHSIKDHIIEIDDTGKVVDVWDINQMLDNKRDVLLKAIDQRAVCMSVDENASSGEATVAADAPFGDFAGVEAGRNWAHINSVYYDESDDSIVISMRHQGVAKIGRDKEVKWILAPFEGWKGDLAKKVLTPVHKNGKKINCGVNKCDGAFDWSFTQHTAYLNPELGKGYLTVFDNGEARGHEQPVFGSEKYSRAVAYKIDEKKMTVQQVWEYGKDRGNKWFSMITGNVNYDKDTNSFNVGTLNVDLMKFDTANSGFINEIKVDKNGKAYLANEIKVNYSSPKEFGYRTSVVKVNNLFGK